MRIGTGGQLGDDALMARFAHGGEDLFATALHMFGILHHGIRLDLAEQCAQLILSKLPAT